MKENTAGVAILAFMNKTKLDLNGEFRITIKKGLSIKGTGLGSSGASAAAGLKAIENLFEKLSIPNNLSNKDKSNILKTADFGVPDNAIPSYFGGLNIIDPKGSRKITSKHKFLFVLTTPKDFGIPTALAREALKGKSAPNDSEIIIQKAIEAFEEGTVFEYAANIEKLHDWFVVPRKKLYPDKIYDKVYATAKNSGSLATTISGAGPTILSIVDNMEVGRKVAQMKYNEFKKNGFDSVSRIVTVDYNGAS
jgi:homoserine kinase